MKTLPYIKSLNPNIEFVRVVDMADEPMISHVRVSGQNMLQYWADVDGEITRYLYLPITAQELTLLLLGETELRSVFTKCTQPEDFLFEDSSTEQSSFGYLSLEVAVSENYVPEPDIKLR